MGDLIPKTPSRDLDSYIATEIFGLAVARDENTGMWTSWHPKVPTRRYHMPHYSTVLEHSTGIVHWLQDRKFFLDSGTSMRNINEMIWRARFFRNPMKKPDFVEGLSLSHAICLAAIDCLEKYPKDLHTLPH